MAPVSDQEFRQMKKFMSDSNFTYTDEWLMACMTWIKENNAGINFDTWKRELIEQWKDANLLEMESSCLPSNLASQRVVKLPGKYGLQVNLMRDIGESSYSQWTKLKKLENENVNVAATDSNECTPTWQPTPKRCVHLTMTDGKQEVYGLEMQPLPGLKLNMKPGFKVMVLGPVDCRRGVIHLRTNNIRIVGGEVEDLFESNRMEKVLADTLKLTSIPATQSTQPQQSARSNSSITTTQLTEEISGEFPDSEDPFPDLEAFSDDDDIFMEIDEEALLRSESSTSNVSTRNSQKATQKVDSRTTAFTEEIEDFEDDFTDNGDGPSSSTITSRSVFPQTSAESKPSSATTKPKPKPVFVPPLVQSRPGSAATGNNKNNTASSSTNSNNGPKSSSVAIASRKTPACSTSFKSAKSALNTNNNNAKQLKIMQYMKPMPVIIDPPTPERQAKRRRRSEEQGQTVTVTSTSTIQHDLLTHPIKEEETDELPNEMETGSNENAEPGPSTSDEDTDFFANSPSGSGGEADVSLMRIVDETVESKILECSTSESSSRTLSVDPVKKSYPIIVPEFPYVFITQLKEKMDVLAQKRKIVKVKACVSTVVSNIKVEQGSWTLCVCINDGTDFLNCKISPNILSDIIGYTPEEMKRIKAEKTKEGKQKIAQGMNNLAATLVHLNAVFEIELGNMPMILVIDQLKSNHATGVKNRLDQLGL